MNDTDSLVKCGIYYFEVIGGNPDKIGWKYIGQSIHMIQRKNKHLHDLRKNKHISRKLLYYYNKYGENSLRFNILHECNKNELNFWEIFWINSFDCVSNGFNIGRGGHDNNLSSKKQCTLANYLTGEIDTCESMEEFGRKHDLSPDAIRLVLLGKARTTKGWYNPNDKYGWQPQKYRVLSPDGTEYELWDKDIISFIRKHIDCAASENSSFYRMLHGQIKSSNGWILSENKNKFTIRRTKPFKLMNPNGLILEGNSIKEFCIIHHLDRSNINHVLLGNKNHYKGWRKAN